jgi:hypothetical protein
MMTTSASRRVVGDLQGERARVGAIIRARLQADDARPSCFVQGSRQPLRTVELTACSAAPLGRCLVWQQSKDGVRARERTGPG